MGAQAFTDRSPLGTASYTQVVDRVVSWLEEIRDGHARRVLVVGHRATHYALEHVLAGIPLIEVVRLPFTWQAGWIYQLPRST